MHVKMRILISVAALTIITPFSSGAQTGSLVVVDKRRMYAQEIKEDKAYTMVALRQVIPAIKYQLWYATDQNFMGRKLYPSGEEAYVRFPVAQALAKVAEDLKQQGLGMMVWDAYRPYRITKKMWKLVQDERYVANPAKGSGHNKGIAIDLTLYELSTGQELEMGTGFDNFSDTAHHGFTLLSASQLQNRALLRTTMMQHGFKPLETEWWHYSWPARSFSVLDLSFKQLRRFSNFQEVSK